MQCPSDGFEDFGDLTRDVNMDTVDAFVTLEPWMFDFQNEVMHVEVSCGDDGWWHGDRHRGDVDHK